MLYLLIPLFPIIIILLGWWLSSRYGGILAASAISFALVCSFLVAFIIRETAVSENNSGYEYDEEAFYPAETWRKKTSVSMYSAEFDYRETMGLFVTNSESEKQISDVLPACLEDGSVSSYEKFFPPIKVTTNPMISLPPPPGKPIHQITFAIPIQFDPEIDTDILGASSYALYKNGEIWCTERVVQRGLGVGMAIAAGQGFQVLSEMLLGFMVTFVAIIILAMMYLEVNLRRMITSK